MDSLLEPEDQLLEKQFLSAPWGDIGRTATLTAVSLLGKLLLNVLNTTNGNGIERFRSHVLNIAERKALITVSNHTR